MVADTCFQNSDFNLKAQFLSLATNTVSCLPWSDRLTSFFFEKMSAKYSSLNNHSFFQARTVFHFEIKGRVQLSTIAQWNSHHLWYTAELLYTYFFTTILKRLILKNWDWIKLIIFTAPSKAFSPFSCMWMTMKKCLPVLFIAILWFQVRQLLWFQARWLLWFQVSSVCSHGICIICVNVNIFFKYMIFLVLLWQFWKHDLQKEGLWGLQRFTNHTKNNSASWFVVKGKISYVIWNVFCA